MKKTTNTIQESYMIAKALVKRLDTLTSELDQQYIIDNNINNPDGSTPEFIYCIEDEEVFENANTAYGIMLEETGLQKRFNIARAGLKVAEEKLIDYALSIAPKRERAILSKSAKENYTTRAKLISLILKLDVSTVN